jgi:hypothetical protein
VATTAPRSRRQTEGFLPQRQRRLGPPKAVEGVASPRAPRTHAKHWPAASGSMTTTDATSEKPPCLIGGRADDLDEFGVNVRGWRLDEATPPGLLGYPQRSLHVKSFLF